MEDKELILFAFAINELNELGFDVKSYIPEDIKLKYIRILDKQKPELQVTFKFRERLVSLVDEFIEKIRNEEEVVEADNKVILITKNSRKRKKTSK